MYPPKLESSRSPRKSFQERETDACGGLLDCWTKPFLTNWISASYEDEISIGKSSQRWFSAGVSPGFEDTSRYPYECCQSTRSALYDRPPLLPRQPAIRVKSSVHPTTPRSGFVQRQRSGTA